MQKHFPYINRDLENLPDVPSSQDFGRHPSPVECFNAQTALQASRGCRLTDSVMCGFGRGKQYGVRSPANPDSHESKGVLQYYIDQVDFINNIPEDERTAYHRSFEVSLYDDVRGPIHNVPQRILEKLNSPNGVIHGVTPKIIQDSNEDWDFSKWETLVDWVV